MGLIPIPKEAIVRIVHYKKQGKPLTREQKLLQKTCNKLEAYLDEKEDLSLAEVNKLLHDLERSILTIQKQKKKIVEAKNRKLRKKRS